MIPIYQVDAFTSELFGGNPAAVCVLQDWLPDHTLQSIAAENNLSETAFLVAGTPDADADYALRWFTPEVEVDLCGHATLASGHIALTKLHPDRSRVAFSTRSGVLVVEREDSGLRMELPADPRTAAEAPPELLEAIGAAATETLGGGTWIAVLETASEVVDLQPDLTKIGALEVPYLIVTAPGDNGSGVDFVSRFFAPGAGIDEDPVTGSAHCALMPYWAERLGSSHLIAKQVSARGGDLDCELVTTESGAELVVLRGTCMDYLTGSITPNLG